MWPLDRVSLLPRVLTIITEARAPSTRRLYLHHICWMVRNKISKLTKLIGSSHPVRCWTAAAPPPTLKVYTAAITANQALIDGRSVGKHNLTVKFLIGARRLNLPQPCSVPLCDLSTVLRALRGPPLQSGNLRSLSLKTALLLALPLVK